MEPTKEEATSTSLTKKRGFFNFNLKFTPTGSRTSNSRPNDECYWSHLAKSDRGLFLKYVYQKNYLWRNTLRCKLYRTKSKNKCTIIR